MKERLTCSWVANAPSPKGLYMQISKVTLEVCYIYIFEKLFELENLKVDVMS